MHPLVNKCSKKFKMSYYFLSEQNLKGLLDERQGSCHREIEMFLSHGDNLHAWAVTASCERKMQRSPHSMAARLTAPLKQQIYSKNVMDFVSSLCLITSYKESALVSGHAFFPVCKSYWPRSFKTPWSVYNTAFPLYSGGSNTEHVRYSDGS